MQSTSFVALFALLCTLRVYSEAAPVGDATEKAAEIFAQDVTKWTYYALGYSSQTVTDIPYHLVQMGDGTRLNLAFELQKTGVSFENTKKNIKATYEEGKGRMNNYINGLIEGPMKTLQQQLDGQFNLEYSKANAKAIELGYSNEVLKKVLKAVGDAKRDIQSKIVQFTVDTLVASRNAVNAKLDAANQQYEDALLNNPSKDNYDQVVAILESGSSAAAYAGWDEIRKIEKNFDDAAKFQEIIDNVKRTITA
jgi:hypothetical protein